MYGKSFIEPYINRGFDINEAKSEVDFLLDALFNYKYTDFVLGKTLENWQILKVQKIIEERTKTRKPIQQIIGQGFFLGRKFLLNESTLIPRPETEILVNELLKLLKKMPQAEVLDIGTGSGCIGISLAIENNNVNVDCIDISEQALNIAEKNALFHNVFDKTRFFKSDLFKNINYKAETLKDEQSDKEDESERAEISNKKYDVIVSNPPYIPIKLKPDIQIEVRDFEPETALFSKDELGIEFYEKIIKACPAFLKDNGYVFFELGINQSNLVEKIFKDNGFKNINIIKDYNSIDRVIFANK